MCNPIDQLCSCSTGGFADDGFEYAMTSGLVSGTNRERNAGCKPYRLSGIFNALKFKSIEMVKGLHCESSCDGNWPAEKHKKPQNMDGYRVMWPQKVDGGSAGMVAALMDQLMDNGSVSVSIRPAISFINYGSGIYMVSE